MERHPAQSEGSDPSQEGKALVGHPPDRSPNQLRPHAVAEEATFPEVRWFWRWLRMIGNPRNVGGSTHQTATFVRALTVLLTFLGLTLASLTPSDGRITPVTLQVLVVVAIWTFASVGFWMLRWADQRPAEGTGALGVILCAGGVVGGFVYLMATHANWALETSHPGGLITGWTADLLFLPCLAVLAPLLLAAIAAGRSREPRLFRPPIYVGTLAAVFILVGVVFEPHLLVVHDPDLTIPLPAVQLPLAHRVSTVWWGASVLIGVTLLCAGILIAFIKARDVENSRDAFAWYEYGGVFALLALIPYLAVTILSLRLAHFVQASARAGVIALALIAVVAIPATIGEFRGRRRMKRLIIGATIAAGAAGLHELGVYMTAKSFGQEGHADLELSGQTVFTYEVLLIMIAIMWEPATRFLERFIERRFDNESDALLDASLQDLRRIKKRLSRALSRTNEAFGVSIEDAGLRWWNFREKRRLDARKEAVGPDVSTIVSDLRVETRHVELLLDQIVSEPVQLPDEDTTPRRGAKTSH